MWRKLWVQYYLECCKNEPQLNNLLTPKTFLLGRQISMRAKLLDVYNLKLQKDQLLKTPK